MLVSRSSACYFRHPVDGLTRGKRRTSSVPVTGSLNPKTLLSPEGSPPVPA